MNITPRTVNEQIITARVQRAQRPVYTTSTGDMPTDLRSGQRLVVQTHEHDPHCFVCGRHTDHYAEHDDMVEAGTAYYTEEGDVWPTGQGPQAWDKQ